MNETANYQTIDLSGIISADIPNLSAVIDYTLQKHTSDTDIIMTIYKYHIIGNNS